jgi:hypothetical protein
VKRLWLASSDKVPAMQPGAVRAVLDAWQGRDWFLYGEEEMARLAVEACRRAFERHETTILRMVGDGDPPAPDDGDAIA